MIDLADLRTRGFALSERQLELRWGLSRRQVRNVLGRSNPDTSSAVSTSNADTLVVGPDTLPDLGASGSAEAALDRWIAARVAEEGGELTATAHRDHAITDSLHSALRRDRAFVAEFGTPTHGEIRASLRRLAS